MGEHSKIGASGMHRWSACPGSVRMSKGLDSPSSFYAAEGTVAHEIAAEQLDKLFSNMDFHFPELHEYLGETQKEEGHDILVTKEMLDSVQEYVDFVSQIMTDARAVGEEPQIWVEKKLHLDGIDDSAFGTADCVIYLPKSKRLIVIDYKHGSGVAVEVTDNPQLNYYAVGAGWDLGAKLIQLCIVQPRCYHEDGPVRTQVITGVQLLEWSMELEAAIEATKDPDAPLCAGDHCRWCPAAAICPTLEELVMEQVKEDFKTDDDKYDPEHLADLLDKVPLIKSWCKKIDEFAYGEAMHGRCPPRHKLVEKRAQRKFKNPIDAKEVILMSFDVQEDDIMTEPELRSPAQIEKVVDKKDAAALKPLISQESTGYVLVDESDKRAPVILGPENDFKPVEVDDEH